MVVAGEWIDVNFLTFSAQGKQDKHLQFSSRRLQEFLEFSLSEKQCAHQNRRYELELSRAYFMTEQLALVDPNLRNLIGNVYVTTFNQLGRLESFNHPQTPGFIYSAKLYNSRAIKTLLQKYQYTPADTQSYKELIELFYDRVAVRSELMTQEQQQRLNLARGVLDKGVELEWAYDLLMELY